MGCSLKLLVGHLYLVAHIFLYKDEENTSFEIVCTPIEMCCSKENQVCVSFSFLIRQYTDTSLQNIDPNLPKSVQNLQDEITMTNKEWNRSFKDQQIQIEKQKYHLNQLMDEIEK